MAYDGNLAYESATEANEQASSFRPFGPTAAVGAALLLGFDAGSPFPATELTLYAWGVDTGARAAVTCGLGATPSYPSATIRWTAWTGFDWTPITLLKDDTLAFTRTGEIVLRTPDNLAATTIAPEASPLFWLRAEVLTSQYERPPVVSAMRTNTMTLTQMETVRDEVLGGSTGRPNQTFRLDQHAGAAPTASSSRSTRDRGPRSGPGVDDFLASVATRPALRAQPHHR